MANKGKNLYSGTVTPTWFDNFWTEPRHAPASLAFGQFTPAHLIMLAVMVVVIVTLVVTYVKSGTKRRRHLRLAIGITVLILELVFRQGIFIVLGMYTPPILPLHACAAVTFCVFIDAVHPNSWTRQFIYAVGTWGPIAAITFPDWANQPIFNLYTWQAFLVHALLMSYALMILIGQDYRPEPRTWWKAAIIMAGFVAVSFVANAIWDTNFWFLNTGSPGSPLEPIQNLTGSFYLPVMVVLVALLWTWMYLPWRRHPAGTRPSISAS